MQRVFGSKQVRVVLEKKRKGLIKKRTFEHLSTALIVVLCLYIVLYCLGIISKDERLTGIKQSGADFINMIYGNVMVRVTDIGAVSSMSENDLSVAERIKKALCSNIIGRVMKKEAEEQNRDSVSVSGESIKETDNELQLKVAVENEQYIKLVEKEKQDNKNKSNNKQRENKKDGGKKAAVALKTNSKLKKYVDEPKSIGHIYNSTDKISFDNLIKKFYTVSAATSIKESDLNYNKAMEKKFKIKGDGSKAQILIYHTHSQEEFSDTNGKAEKSILGVGDYLTTILREQFGYNVIHDKTTYDVVNGKLDRNKAYDQSRRGVKKILKDNPSISLILDIHRDGVKDGVRLVTKINKKPTAQIMFFNGMSRFSAGGDIDYLYNPNLKDNLALSLQMKMAAEAYYPNFTRHNYINAYQYNLDLMPQCMLIEMGAQTNTFAEVKNACEPLAMLIHMTLGK